MDRLCAASTIQGGVGVFRLQILIGSSLVAASTLFHGSEIAAETRVGRWFDRESVQQFGGPAGGSERRFGQGVRSVGGRLAANLKERATGLADTLSPKARVIKADDPTSLATATPPLSPDVYIASARMHQFSRNFDKATEFYNRVLELEPGNLDALVGFGRMLDRQNNYAEAATYYEQATSHHPANASAFNDLGLCYARQGKLAKSIQSLQTAIQLNPESKLYRNNIATVLVENNQLNEAQRFLVDAHGEAAASYNVGYLLYQRGDSETARQFFAQAISSDPQFQAAQAMLARIDRKETSNHVVQWPAADQGGQLTAEQSASVPGPNYPASGHEAGVQMPTRTARSPRTARNAVAPLPEGESFLYSNSVIEHLPPTQ